MSFHIEQYTDKKHLLIIGKSKSERKKFVDEIVSTTNKVVHRFKTGLNNFDEYINQVRTVFPFIPLGWEEQNPKKWTLNQVWDFHLSWTDDTSGVLIILEEFEEIEENWKVQIIRDYIMTSYYKERTNGSKINFQLVMTLPQENDLIEKVTAEIGLNDNEKRTEEQVVNGKIKTINLDY